MINQEGQEEAFEIECSGYSENENRGWAFSGAKTSAIGEAAKYLLWQMAVYKGEYKAPEVKVDWSKPGLVIVPFGKHKDKTIAQIWKDAPDYVIWLSEKSNNANVKKASELFLDLSLGGKDGKN